MNEKGDSSPLSTIASETNQSIRQESLPGVVAELLPVSQEQLIQLFKRLPEIVKNASSSRPREQEMVRLFRRIVAKHQDHLTSEDYFAAVPGRKSIGRLNNLRSHWNHVAKQHLRYWPDVSRQDEFFFPACTLEPQDQWPKNTIHFVWQHGSKSRSPVESKNRRDSIAQIAELSPQPGSLPSGHNLKLELTHFIGRLKEKDAVKGRLQNHSLVTLTGVGGSGKTRLAVEVALELLPSYTDGVRMVELARVSDPQQIPTVIAEALRLPNIAGQTDLLDQLVSFLSNRQVLLIIDNCEHVAADCARVLSTLLSRRGRLRVLATSRVALRVQGEGVFSVPTLDVPSDGNLLSLADLQQNEAIQLFSEHARGGTDDFKLSSGNSRAVAQICRRVDGIPMCIVLAASRVKCGDSPQRVAKSLEDLFDALSEENPVTPKRHQTAKALIDWSYDLLTPRQQSVFHRLAVLRGGWSDVSAQAVCSDHVIPAKAVGEDHDKLFLCSLINASTGPDGTQRFRLLEPLREYAGEKLERSAEAQQVHQRHLEYFARLARESAQLAYGEKDSDRLGQLEEELANFRAAITWSLQLTAESKSAFQTAMELVADLTWFWVESGRRIEGNRYLQAFLTSPLSQDPTRARCRVLTAICRICPVASDGISPANRHLSEENLKIAQRIKDQSCLADALGVLAAINESELEWKEARRLWRQALNAWESLRQVRGMCNAMLGMARAARTDQERAELAVISKTCLKAAQDQGDYLAVSHALHHLASEARLKGRFAESRTQWEQCLAANYKIAFVGGYELALTELMKGYLDDADGQLSLELQSRHLRKAQAFFQSAFDEAGRGHHGARMLALLFGLARCSRIKGDADEVRSGLRRIVEVLQQTDDAQADSSPLLRAAFEYFQIGDDVPALPIAERGVDIARRIGNQDDLRWGTTLMAMLLSRLGRQDESVEQFRAALTLSKETGHAMTVAFSVYLLVSQLIHVGQFDRADAEAKEVLSLDDSGIDPGWKGTLELMRGGLALAQRRYPVARRHYKKCLDIFVQSGRTADILAGIQAIGMCAGAKSDWHRAVILFGAASRPVGVDFVFAYNPQYALFSGMARHWLGAQEYDRGFEAGRRMQLLDAIKLAKSTS